MDGQREDRLQRPDGRIVAWAESGDPAGIPVLRSSGTPTSRLSRPPSWETWEALGLHLIATERPGFGASTRLPGRGFNEHADDLAAILDALHIERVAMLAVTGGSPHLLAFAARHPDRVLAGTIVGGAAPMTLDDIDDLIPLNRLLFDAIEAQDHAAVVKLLTPFAEQLVDDPLTAIADAMESANETDRERVIELSWQRRWARNMRDALSGGVEGWADESLAFGAGWAGIDLAAVTTSITWFHAPDDRTAPLSAAKRLLAQLPTAKLIEFAPTEGANYSPEQERVILTDLLNRSQSPRASRGSATPLRHLHR